MIWHPIDRRRWCPDHFVRHHATQKPIGPPYVWPFPSLTPYKTSCQTRSSIALFNPWFPIACSCQTFCFIFPEVVFRLLLLLLLRSDCPTTDSTTHSIPTHSRLFDFWRISSVVSPPPNQTGPKHFVLTWCDGFSPILPLQEQGKQPGRPQLLLHSSPNWIPLNSSTEWQVIWPIKVSETATKEPTPLSSRHVILATQLHPVIQAESISKSHFESSQTHQMNWAIFVVAFWVESTTSSTQLSWLNSRVGLQMVKSKLSSQWSQLCSHILSQVKSTASRQLSWVNCLAVFWVKSNTSKSPSCIQSTTLSIGCWVDQSWSQFPVLQSTQARFVLFLLSWPELFWVSD